MLYSIGKDSSVMLRLAEKAFYPGKIPFPMLHVDTGFKFSEMIEFRDRTCRELGLRLLGDRGGSGQVAVPHGSVLGLLIRQPRFATP